MNRPSAIAVVLLIAGIAGVIVWWRVEPIPAPTSCPDGGVFSLDADGVARCGAGAELPAGQALTLHQKFDCNAASADELALVPGLGRAVAIAIVDARPDGGFENWEQIDAIEGVGPARLIALQSACEFRAGDAGVW